MKSLIKIFLLSIFFFSIVSYTKAQSGTLDNTFDGDGIKVINSPFVDEGHCVAIDANDRILIGGYLAGPTTAKPEDFTLFRLNEDGSFDNTFGAGGKKTIAVGDHGGVAQAITFDQNGKILVTGYAKDVNDCKAIVVVRLNSDGSLDNSFDGDGIAKTSCLGGSSFTMHINGLTIQSDGKVIVLGTRRIGPDGEGLVVRFNVNGTIDNDLWELDY